MASAPAMVPITHKKSPQAPAKRSSTTPSSVGIGIAYERFLEMPVAFVLGALWLAGVALMGSCAFVLYLVLSALI